MQSDPSSADGDHVAAPDERRRFSFDCNRPQLMKRESDIVTAAGVIKDARSLIRAARSAAPVRRAQRHYALIIHIKKFPVQARLAANQRRVQ